jgi:DNA mismatch repair ATPase MutS
MMESQHPLFSLLWPEGTQLASTHHVLDARVIRDLDLDLTLSALAGTRLSQTQIRDILAHLCTDPAVIEYRQDILDDLWRNPLLNDRLETLWPDLNALYTYRSSADRARSALQDVTWRLGELEQLVTCVTGLHDLFIELGGELHASGWKTLRDGIAHLVQDPVYQHLVQELPDMLQTIRAKTSVTIGVNLDHRLRPVAATLLSVNDRPFTASSFLHRLLGRQGEADQRGIGPLHTVPHIAQSRSPFGLDGTPPDINPLMVPLFNDLANVLEAVCRPIAKALRHYVALQSGFLGSLSGDIAFYLAAVGLMTRLQNQGLPLCRPKIAPMDARVCDLQDAYNLNLALYLMKQTQAKDRLIRNEVHMGDNGRILIVTGPNQGGKTTYTQMIGLCHILAQAGLWAPAAAAHMSPVDGIYTHYPIEETLESATGRFGDEAQRLNQMFTQATRYSLMLFNESLSSTSAGESLYIAQDVVRILRRMGVRAIFATHLHELAADIARLNRDTNGDSRIVSLVASRIDSGEDRMHRSYKITPGSPMGRSYAREIAAKYGISYEQLTSLLQQRRILD